MTTKEFKQLYDVTSNSKIKFLFDNKDFKFIFELNKYCSIEQKENNSFSIVKSATIKIDDSKYICRSIKNLSLIETIKFLNKEEILCQLY